jgi:hypothetical protein
MGFNRKDLRSGSGLGMRYRMLVSLLEVLAGEYWSMYSFMTI